MNLIKTRIYIFKILFFSQEKCLINLLNVGGDNTKLRSIKSIVRLNQYPLIRNSKRIKQPYDLRD